MQARPDQRRAQRLAGAIERDQAVELGAEPDPDNAPVTNRLARLRHSFRATVPDDPTSTPITTSLTSADRAGIG